MVGLPAAAFRGILPGAGLPPPVADIFVDADLQISKGALDDSSGDLARLVGCPLVPLSAFVAMVHAHPANDGEGAVHRGVA